MRKFLTLLALFAMLLLAAAPVMAQSRPTLTEFLTNDGRFSTLLSAVEAAGLSDALNSAGPLTLLAPTDDAFAALPIGALDYLINNPEALASVLAAHVIPGEKYMVREIIGGVTVDAISGDPITFALASSLLTANGVRISSADQVVENGVVHIVDSVIIPDSASELLDAATAMVRVGHFSPDIGTVDIALNGSLVLEGVTFGTVSDWIMVIEGEYTLDVRRAGEDEAVSTVTTTVTGGDQITIAARGVVATDDFTLQLIPEDTSAIGSGQARVTVFHAIQDAPAIDVIANGDVVINRLSYPGTIDDNDGVDTVNLAATTYDILVVPYGTTSPVLRSLPDTILTANTHYFIVVYGTPGNPSVALAVTPGS